MRCLFSPVGDTDPVRNFRDGALLHILRHYKTDHVFIFLTKDMEMKEENEHCYTNGVKSVSPNTQITFIKSGITEPQNYEKLDVMQYEFDKCYSLYPDADWLLNTSSGTPQMKTVVSIIALDSAGYPNVKAIQVYSPEKSSNRGHPPCEKDDINDMIKMNEDNQEDAPNRCKELSLSLLKKHNVNSQIKALISDYDYSAAWKLARQNKSLYSSEVIKLLKHAMYREMLRTEEAQNIINEYKGNILIDKINSFDEYFQIMEMCQRKGNFSDFIIRLSPILVEIGYLYLKHLSSKVKNFKVRSWIRKNRQGVMLINRDGANVNNPEIVAYIEGYFMSALREGPLSFEIIYRICEYYASKDLKDDASHNDVTEIFGQLRKAEQNARNLVAHQITNMTEEKIRELTSDEDNPAGFDSRQIVKMLQKVIAIVRGKPVIWSYDNLNQIIADALKF